jgi:uncharacterized membrane protein YidH (DUF202 family)
MVNSIDTQPAFNGYVSQIRNMFLTSSIAIALMAFSIRFRSSKKHVKLISISIISFSILYGYTASRDFNNYLNYMYKQDNLTELNILQFNQWRSRILFSYVYIFILIIIAMIIVFKKIV